MKLLKIQEYLQNNSIEKLKKEFSIQVKQHSEFPNLYLFKYNQINSPFNEQIVQECRGLILDKEDNWKIVCMTYKKFFNYGEPCAAKLNWNKSKCLEKVDGSLIQMFYYKNKWRIATSGMPDAKGGLENFNVTFNDLFWKIWKNLKYKLPYTKCLCYAFELISPYNKNVVQYNREDIILHGVRNLENLHEIDPKPIAKLNEWYCVKEYTFSNINEIVDWCKEINPMKREGFVIVDDNFNRLKVKSPQYVALHHTKSSMSIRKILDIVKTNEHAEFLTYFPEYKKLYDEIKQKYNNFIIELIKLYESIKYIYDQKEFALEAVKSKFCTPLFLLRKGQIKSIREYMNNLPSKKLIKIMGLKDETN